MQQSHFNPSNFFIQTDGHIRLIDTNFEVETNKDEEYSKKLLDKRNQTIIILNYIQVMLGRKWHMSSL